MIMIMLMMIRMMRVGDEGDLGVDKLQVSWIKVSEKKEKWSWRKVRIFFTADHQIKILIQLHDLSMLLMCFSFWHFLFQVTCVTFFFLPFSFGVESIITLAEGTLLLLSRITWEERVRGGLFKRGEKRELPIASSSSSIINSTSSHSTGIK